VMHLKTFVEARYGGVCLTSYLGGGAQEDHSLRPSWTKS
jgi:hypothetical protein